MTKSTAAHAALILAVALALPAAAPALAAELRLGDLAAQQPRRLSHEELEALLPGASVARVSLRGQRHRWTHQDDGRFVLTSGRPGGDPARERTPGRWRLDADGRYCVVIEWRVRPTEDWCRFLFRTPDGAFYAARDDRPAATAHRLEIRPRGTGAAQEPQPGVEAGAEPEAAAAPEAAPPAADGPGRR